MSVPLRAAIAVGVASLATCPVARAEPAHETVVWYRASEQCPTGSDFLARMQGANAQVRLAGAGDHIDFVVTLLATKDGTVGRLERQTLGGTVAIRELADSSCAKVAEGLALSLELALEPQSANAATNAASPALPASTSAPANAAEPAPVVAPEPAPALSPLPRPVMQIEAPKRRMAAGGSSAAAPARPREAAVLDAATLLGAAPKPLFGADFGGEIENLGARLMPSLTLRATAVAAFGSSETAIGRVREWLILGDVAACPWRLGSVRAFVRPCLDFQLGALGASGSRTSGETAVGTWAAPGLSVRPRIRLAERLGLEASALVLAPLSRAEITDADSRLFRVDSIVFSASLGLVVGPF